MLHRCCLIVALILAPIWGCDTFTVTDAGIAISASSSHLEAHESSEIVVTVSRTADGQRVPHGYRVNVVLTQNESGASLKVMNNVADHEGRVTALYTAGSRAGTDVIQASGEGGEKASVVMYVSYEPKRVEMTLTASPNQLNSAEYSAIEVRLSDNAGQPLLDQLIQFELTQNQSEATITPVNPVTNAQGIATALYQAGPQGGLDILRVTEPEGGTRSTVIQISPVEDYTRLELTAEPAEVLPQQYSDIQISVTRADGAPIRNYLVLLSIIRNDSGATVIAVNEISDTDGRVRAIYRAGQKSGIDILQARGPDGAAASVAIIVRE